MGLTFFLSSIIAFILCNLFKSFVVTKKLGLKFAVFCLIAILISSLVFLEFSDIYKVYLNGFYILLKKISAYSVWKQDSFQLTVGKILLVVWLTGIIIGFIVWIQSYRQFSRYLSLLSVIMPEKILMQCNPDFELLKYMEKVKIVSCNQVISPCLFGFRRPYLLLPKSVYNGEQLRYVIFHELEHLKNGDIVWRSLIDIICISFWWNPFLWYCRKELFQILEMRCDLKVVAGLPEMERVAYMECLADIAEQLIKKEPKFGVSFNRSSLKKLEWRIRLLAEKEAVCRWRQISLGVLTTAFFFFCSMLVFVPYQAEAGKKMEKQYALPQEILNMNYDGNAYFLTPEGNEAFQYK